MIWQTNFSSSTKKTSAENLAYWQNQLKTIPPRLDTVWDFPNYQDNSVDNIWERSTLFKRLDLKIADSVKQKLDAIAQENNLDLELIFLSAYYLLLYRYTAQSVLTIGYDLCSPNNLSHNSIYPLIFKLDDQASSFIDLLAYTKNLVCTVKSHQNIEYEEFKSLIQSQTAENILPWYQILFSCDRHQQSLNSRLIQKQFQQSELLLDIDQQLFQISLEFNSNLLLPETAQRIINNYYRLLEDIAEHPQKQLKNLSYITEIEQDLVLNQWNQTQVNRESRCIHQLFEMQAAQNPDTIALKYQDEQLTYQQLNQKANQLAHFLKTQGVKPNSLVGLYLERSPTMVIGVLAILKTGAGYVPLDPENPPARLSYILQDSQITLLLTEANLATQSFESTPLQSQIYLDRDWNLIEQQSVDNLNLDCNLEDIAQIVYTSGSTGKPKGVIITQGNLSHYAHSLQIALDINPTDVYLYRGSIALIVSARQLLMPLAQGAAVSILTTADKKDPLRMFELIKQHGVTIVDRVPSFWRNFSGILNSLTPAVRQSLMDNQIRLVAAGGEQVSVEIYQCWRQLFKPQVKLANIYGQTEGTGVVTIYYIPETINQDFKSLPVGSPIPNMRVYVLDQDLAPVPIGVTGEIHISGAGVAQGYLNRPELTTQKFIPNPYLPGERLYKTGDLGRYLADGTIQFQGRSDRQVNINGLRIELGEIETTLVQHQQILESAVVVQKNKLNQTIAAYVVTEGDSLTPGEISDFLRAKLPSYMVPSQIILCDSLSLTPSGKIDRNALIANSSKQQNKNYVAPNSPIELTIIQILENILGIDRISTEADFITIGGNSLIAARLVAEIEQQYQQKIPISRVFQSSTPRALAKLIQQEEKITTLKSFVPIKQGSSNLILFGIHNLGHGLELYRPLANNLSQEISLYGLSSYFSDESDVPHPRDIRGLAEYYAQRIQIVQSQDPYNLMGVSFGGVLAYEIACQLVKAGRKVNFVGLIDTFLPDQESAAKILPLPERIKGHLKKIKAKGASHILARIKWRSQAISNYTRFRLYEIDWIKDRFADPTSRSFAKAEYVKRKKEYKIVNQGYEMKPYPGRISLFRATEDMDLKLGWQELAQLGLSIYDVPGEHLEILEEPNVKILAQKLQAALLKEQSTFN